MRAVVLKAFGEPLSLEDVPPPVIGTGEVIVDVAASRVLSYMGEVLSGTRRYLLDLPVIPGPGGVGRIRQTGPDATQLKPGDWVYCDPTIRSRDNPLSPDITLMGLSAGGEGGLRLQKYYRDGAWAEQMRLPTENVTPIGSIEPEDAPKWALLGMMLVPYGGFLAARLQPGETLLINGATGSFGSAGVAAALAMGVRAVIATGRNTGALAALARRFGPRVIPVAMTGDEDADRRRILETAPAPIDVALDILPPAATTSQVRAGIMTVRPGGRIALMGGVGFGGGPDLPLPYHSWIQRQNISIHGQWMYPQTAARTLVGMVRGGLIDLDLTEVTAFHLEQVDEAIAHAAANSGPFKMTALTP